MNASFKQKTSMDGAKLVEYIDSTRITTHMVSYKKYHTKFCTIYGKHEIMCIELKVKFIAIERLQNSFYND